MLAKYNENEMQHYLIYISIQTPEAIFYRHTFGGDYSFESSWVCLYQLCTSGDFLPFFPIDFLKLCEVRWGAVVNINLQVRS